MAKIFDNLKLVAIPVILLWLVEIVNIFLGHSLAGFGILPRSVHGLLGIPLAPFIHGSPFHALSNTFPLLILGGLVMTEGRQRYLQVMILLTLISGILVWLIGRTAFHIGASGVIFGLFGYLLANGFWKRDAKAIIIAGLVILFYGGMAVGLLPLSRYISFEAHIAGFFSGIVLAWGFAKQDRLGRTV